MQAQTILMTGASGLVGREVTRSLSAAGHRVLALQRDGQTIPFWDLAQQRIELGAEQQIDVVIHLAGENIAAGRWTSARKARIRQSRVAGTHLLATFFARAKQKPKVFISASAVGYYGDQHEEELTEASPLGTGFLADVAQAWEAATQPASAAGIRVVFLRFGIILSPKGGALAKMLFPFTMGLGGALGSGQQWMSWISLDEIANIVSHIVQHEELTGPINIVSPHPVRNREFTKTLAAVLHRPAFFPAPSFLLNMLFGEMAQELLLASTKVKPHRLLESGYVFQEAELKTAFCHLLHKNG
jgi:uncharacterized protein (TIGR01777 family)